MARMRVLCAGGDRIVEWDGKQVEAGDAEALAAVAEAERIFVEHGGAFGLGMQFGQAVGWTGPKS